MKITSESTTAFDQALARRLPPDLLRMVLHNEDELQRLQAQQSAPDPHKLQAMQDRARNGRAYRTMRLEAAIEDLVHDHRPQLRLPLWKSRRSRAEWAQKQIHGEYVPGWRYIDTYLNTLHI
ncbi:hypothetical protein [Pseudomonas sp. DP16D-R1]|uniref:hypothetical protein n=1 Tax=Pseudomonas sp. DP16D-R1 TaxID=2075551 RepID=UPI000CD0220F|nr:hypothetical protein [Pseudomonas sp. DP16D-R1]POA78004.1 hypothetical protein C1890_12365 [Pseudomonas sp. DP16D-R1]